MTDLKHFFSIRMKKENRPLDVPVILLLFETYFQQFLLMLRTILSHYHLKFD